MDDKTFKKITSKNEKEVKKWPKWKQNIVISAETAKTGKFIKTKTKFCKCDKKYHKIYHNIIMSRVCMCCGLDFK